MVRVNNKRGSLRPNTLKNIGVKSVTVLPEMMRLLGRLALRTVQIPLA